MLATLALALGLLLAAAAPAEPPPLRPWPALRRLEALLAAPPELRAALTPTEQLQLQQAAAEAFESARLFQRAVAARNTALSIALAGAANESEALRARIDLAGALSAAGRFDDALGVVREARSASSASASASASPPSLSADRGLWRAEARALDCAGRSRDALEAFEHSLPVADSKQARDYLSLLLRVQVCGADNRGAGGRGRGATCRDKKMAALYGDDDEPRCVSAEAGAAAEAERARVERALLGAGPYERADQLPDIFVPGLQGGARPWLDAPFDAPWPRVAALAALLEAAAPRLRAEYASVRRRASGLFLSEAECISDPAVGSSAAWSYLTVNAPWVELVDAAGCSVATPAACALLDEARTLGFDGPALRGSYSVLSGGARLRPHCGHTNAQLKLHVGLVVPTRPVGEARAPCATLTVAGESRAWAEGRVLAFDDSFRHSVSNDCRDEERVVFQLAVPHPGEFVEVFDDNSEL